MSPNHAIEAQKTLFGHPRGLFVLFFAEMWERFSYYGMRALLIFYLVQHWMFSDSEASVIYGAYTALVYIAPVVGGYLADRYLGQRKAVLFGAVLLTFGHFLMAFEGTGGQDAAEINIFWLALSFISSARFPQGQHLGEVGPYRAPTSGAIRVHDLHMASTWGDALFLIAATSARPMAN